MANKKELLKKIINSFLFFLFYKKCIICSKNGYQLCQDCCHLIELENGFLFNGKNRAPDLEYLNKVYWATNYENFVIKKLIRKYKYSPFYKNLFSVFSKILSDFVELNELNFNEIDLIINVPSTIKKKKWRGFDHIEKFCLGFSDKINIPTCRNNLIKIKNTKPQIALSKEERKENVENAFFVKNPEEIKEKNIILIDDVMTTGATLNECAKTLKLAGCKKIYGLTIARD